MKYKLREMLFSTLFSTFVTFCLSSPTSKVFYINSIYFFLFSVKKKFPKKKFNSVVGVSFRFPEITHDAQTSHNV